MPHESIPCGPRNARLVGVELSCLPQFSGNAVNCGGNFFIATHHGARHATRTGAVADKILADICGAFKRQ
jgi:hypothetical protein